MTVVGVPDRLLTLQEWDELPDDTYRHAELAKGILQVSPSPTVRHQVILTRLMMQLAAVTADEQLVVVPDIDVLIARGFPATIRQPDISVVQKDAVSGDAKRLGAADVVLAIEIVSPGSGRRDRVIKLAEYAEAGIPHYWIVTIDRSAIGLNAFRLDYDSYRPSEHAEGGTVTVADPFSVTLDLDALGSW